MENIRIKEVMIPIAEYVTVKKEDGLMEVLHAMERKRKATQRQAHRDAIVVDGDGRFLGKVTMIDIFRSLDPNYRKVSKAREGQTLTAGFVMKAIREFNLWLEPAEDICARGSKVTVSDAMHIPEQLEFVQEEDPLEKALNFYVMGAHQPLIVKNGDIVTGVLRFGDIFEVVRERLLNCEVA